jgi:HAMP domain-containing protein
LSLRTRIIILTTVLLLVTVITLTGALTWTARSSLLAQTEEDGLLIAMLLARSAEYAGRIPGDVEDAIGEQMIVEASIAAHMVAIAEEAGLSPDEINARLRDITDRTALNEFWITDETGRAYLRNVAEIEFSFSPNPAEQPQAHVFWALLTGQEQQVIQEARQREVDTQVFKYAGVVGVDRPRIVQVGYHASFLEELRQQMGLGRLVEDLVGGGNVAAIRVVDRDRTTLAYCAMADAGLPEEPSETEIARLAEAIRSGEAASYVEGDLLGVVAPIADEQGEVTGATLVTLPTDRVQATIRRNLQIGVPVAALVLLVGLASSVLLARRVTEPVTALTDAAVAVEAGAFDPQELAPVAERKDELGGLARLFQRMAREVQAREEQLRQQLQRLRIEIDESKRKQQVEEITDSDYFRKLSKKAEDLRQDSDD